ncbi:MAG: hypothetical protein RMM29_04995 [Planctomycetota bacterium]|nr:hypothetical protein [Planctomycetota bacterium]MDW8372991.1 hypothetical protein [Planctomycetota bacterium]
MAVKPLSERGRLIVLALARRQAPMSADELARELPHLGDLSADLADLVEQGTITARSAMSAAELRAELEHIWPYLVKAQQTGSEFRWKTRNVCIYELTKIGRDMAPLLAHPRP